VDETLLDEPRPLGVGPGVMRSLWRHRVAILCLALLCAVVAYAVTTGQPKQYTARGFLLLANDRPFDPLGTNQQVGQWVLVQTEFLKSDEVTARAVKDLNQQAAQQLARPFSSADVRRSIDFQPVSDANQILLVANARSPKAAERIVDAVIVAYRATTLARTEEQAALALDGVSDPSVTRDVRQRAAVYGDGVALSHNAALPTVPSAPLPRRTAGLAALFGLLLGSALSVARETAHWAARREREAQPNDPERLPSVPGDTARISSLPAPGSVAAAAYRITLLGLQRLQQQRNQPLRSLMVTSFDRKNNALLVAINLAAAAAASGAQVLLIDADEERGRVSALAPKDNDQARGHRLSDLEWAKPGSPSTSDGGSRIVIGTVRNPEASGPVTARQLATALSEWLDAADLVIVAAASLHTSPQSFALAALVDGGVVVVGEDVLTEADRRQWALANLNVLGLLPQSRTDASVLRRVRRRWRHVHLSRGRSSSDATNPLPEELRDLLVPLRE